MSEPTGTARAAILDAELASALAQLTDALAEVDRLRAEAGQARRWARAWRLLAEEYRDTLRDAWDLRFILKHRDRQISRTTGQWWREKVRADAAEAEVERLRAVETAAHEWEEAQRLYVGMFEASDDAGAVVTAEHRLNRAEDALRAALEAQP